MLQARLAVVSRGVWGQSPSAAQTRDGAAGGRHTAVVVVDLLPGAHDGALAGEAADAALLDDVLAGGDVDPAVGEGRAD